MTAVFNLIALLLALIVLVIIGVLLELLGEDQRAAAPVPVRVRREDER